MRRPDPIELLVGYSFGISPHSAPGALNKRIAERLAQDLSSAGNNRFVGVQWEVADALVLQGIDPNRSCDCIVPPAVPPFFCEDDIPNLNQLREVVRHQPALTHILETISLHSGWEDPLAFPNRAVSYLNRLLHDRSLFRQFQSLRLPPLKKTKSGREWRETRAIPPTTGPDMEMYQAQRINRLILESILFLPKANYIATYHVAETVLTEVCRCGLTIARVRVYGHPAHVERCRIQTVESAWKIGIRLNPSEVDVIPCGDPQMAAPENWDPDNAQEWVQSWDNWQQHEGSMPPNPPHVP
jgi:hypothetical protein